MTIKEIWDIDTGEYVIEASNPFGTDTATVQLKVQGIHSFPNFCLNVNTC